MKMSDISMLATAAILLVLISGCKSEENAAATSIKTVSAQTTRAVLNDIPVTDDAPGAIIAEQQVQVASRLMGYIREISVHEGDAVKKGQLLFTIDPTDIQGGVNQARAGLAQADAALSDAKSDYERFSNLYKEESISKMQYDKVKLQYSVAQSQANAAQAGLNTAESQLRYAAVRSPIDGVVAQKMSNAGDLAAPGRPILIIENPAKLIVQTSVSDETYSYLKKGGSASVEISGSTLAGKIVRLVSAGDPMSHTHLVKVELPGINSYGSGTFARVRFTTGSRKGIALPKSALLERAGIAGVFVVDADGVVRYRMVRIGSELDGLIEIAAGVNAGETIIVSNTGEFDSGDRLASAGSSHS
ncbi:MAG: efflux RND transporter periplasmic adaptor subunit [Gallionella sp.]